MKYKRAILVICLILCIFFCISAASANENLTDDSLSGDIVAQDDSQSSVIEDGDSIMQSQDGDLLTQSQDEGTVSQVQDEDILSASKTVYFDASAKSDGTGSKSNPYKYVKSDRLKSVTTAYFAKGTYSIPSSLIIDNKLSSPTTIIGESSKNTVFKTSLDDFGIRIKQPSGLILKDVTLNGVKVNNLGTLNATNVVFKNNYEFWHGTINCPGVDDGWSYVNLVNCSFRNNLGDSSGGAISVEKTTVNIQNCKFYNSSSYDYGGAIYAWNSTINIFNSNFDYNRAEYGGAIYVVWCNVTAYGSRFNECEAKSYGGAISSDKSKVWIDSCNFTNFISTDDAGGALYLTDGTLDVSSSLFINGTALFGGSICSLNTNYELWDNQFENNYARYGGGSVYAMACEEATISDNLFFMSFTDGAGGAICNMRSDSLSITDNIFESCNAMGGFAIAVDGENGTFTEDNNIYKGLYTVVCEYNGFLNGEEFTHLSNSLVFSISNDGDYIIPENDEGLLNTHYSDYIDFNISIANHNSNILNSTLGSSARILFNLARKSSSLVTDSISVYLVDEAGHVMGLQTTKFSNYGYYNYNLITVDFDEDFMVSYHNDSFYFITQDSSVPLVTYKPSQASSVPSYYDSRDKGYVTPVKDQGHGGNCWAFAGLATLEACIKKATGLTYDFSEENVKNIMSMFSLFGRNTEINDGGIRNMILGYLTSWLGPINDADDVYDPQSALSEIYNAIFHIQDVVFLPDTENNYDNDYIKKAIMKYGAVTVSFDWDDETKHAVSLVGWDDYFFDDDYSDTYAEGVWIFKNSWGDTEGDNGYQYLSYDKPLDSIYTFEFTQDRGYSNIYQYDFSGLSSFDFFSDEIYYKTKFRADNSEILSAVSTYFKESTQFNVSIYLNDELVSAQTGYSLAGYHTIALENEVQLSPGDEYVVVFHKFGNKNNYLPYSKHSDSVSTTYAKVATFDYGVSYYSHYGSVWYDLYNGMYGKSTACIKAFTRPAELKQVEIDINKFTQVELNKQVSIRVDLPQYYLIDNVPHYLNGLVKFKIGTKYYYAKVKNGHAVLNVKFDKTGSYALTAQYVSNLETSNIVSFSFSVKASVSNKITISADPVTKYYGGDEKYVATIYENGLIMKGVSVKISTDGKTSTVKTNSYGQAVLDLKLNPGTYNVVCQYGGVSYTSSFVVKSTLSSTDSSGRYPTACVNATFLDSTGNYLNSGLATFSANGKVFKAKVNAKGVASANIDLPVGSYVVTITNPATGEKTQSNLEVSRGTSHMNVSFIQEGHLSTFVLDLGHPSITGQCSLKLDSDTYYYDLVDGKAVFEFNDLEARSYQYNAYYPGNNDLMGSMVYGSVTVSPANVVLSAQNLNFYYSSSNNKFKVTVTDLGAPVIGKAVKININNKNYSAYIDSNGQASFDVNENAGLYIITASYGGRSISNTVNVKTTILADDMQGIYQSTNINAKFIDSTGTVINNRFVTFRIGKEKIDSLTNSNGIANPKVDLNAGNYTVKMVNPITNEHKEVRLIILKNDISISTMSFEATGDHYVLNIRFSNAPTGKVTIDIEGSQYSNSISGQSASVKFYISKTKNYTVIIRYSGDENFNQYSTSRYLSFTSRADIIKSQATTVKYLQDRYLKVTLLDFSKAIKANSKVKMVIDGINVKYHKSMNLVTNSKGIAEYELDFGVGSYYATLTTANGASKKVKVVIKKNTPTITAKSKTYSIKTKTKKFTAVMDLPAYYLQYYKLTLKVNGKTYSAKSNRYGEMSFKITNLNKKGTYRAYIKFAGDKNLNKVGKYVYIRVK